VSITAITSKDELLALQDVLQASSQSGATVTDIATSFEQALARIVASESTTAGSAGGSSGTLSSPTQALSPAATFATSSSSMTAPASTGAVQVSGTTLQDVANAAGLSAQDALSQYSSGALTIANAAPDGEATNFGGGAVGTTYDPLSKTWITPGQLVNGNFPEAQQVTSQQNAALPGTAAGQSVSYAQMVAYQQAGYFPNAQGQWTPGGN